MEEPYNNNQSLAYNRFIAQCIQGLHQYQSNSLTAQLSCYDWERGCTGPQSLLLIVASLRQKKHTGCTFRMGATQRSLLRKLIVLWSLIHAVTRTNMAAGNHRHLSLLLQKGVAADIVKEKEKCQQLLSKSLRKINAKKTVCRGIHSRDLLAEALIPRWKVKQYFSAEPIALK